MSSQHVPLPAPVGQETAGTLVLDRSQTRAALPLDELLAAVRDALVAVSRGDTSAPARATPAESTNGALGAMTGHVPGIGLVAKVVSLFPGATHNSHRGVVEYFDSVEGAPLALLDAQTITALRTAASATVAMQAVARPGNRGIAVLGTGMQASAQLEFLSLIGATDVTIGARNRDNADALVAQHGIGTTASVEDAVRSAETVFCCTSSSEPVVRRSWLAEGAHVSSVGGGYGWELDLATVNSAAVYTEWAGAADEPPPAGAWELQELGPARPTVIGHVLDGHHAGRSSDGELTVFKSTGHAALDVAAAAVAYHMAQAHRIGLRVDL